MPRYPDAISPDAGNADSTKTYSKVVQKRGRKLTDPVQYFADSEQKIQEWKHLFKTNPSMTKAEK
jgi:hypothetical protein